ncbi:MAG: CinA family protein [Spirochaetaceae bacterium]
MNKVVQKAKELPETLIGRELTDRKQTISCAESCTGGKISHHLSRFSGSSAYFYGGVVAYDNSVKENVLQVSGQDLLDYGAVSKQVVEQMALGVKKLIKTDWAVATSGIAGPTGGTAEKPVGTVWIAWAGPGGVKSKMFNFTDSREDNIKLATDSGLMGILELIKMENKHE